MRRVAIGVVLVCALVLGRPAHAHEGHAHKVLGTVTAVEAERVEVLTKDGKQESFLLTKDTRYRRGKALAGPADLKVGARAVLTVVEQKGHKNVTEVLLGEPEAKPRSK